MTLFERVSLGSEVLGLERRWVERVAQDFNRALQSGGANHHTGSQDISSVLLAVGRSRSGW